MLYYCVRAYDFVNNKKFDNHSHEYSIEAAEATALEIAGQFCENESPAIRKTNRNGTVAVTTDCDFGALIEAIE
jgi:hypothetical protein